MSESLLEDFRSRLKGLGTPFIRWCDTKGEHVLSAAALWNRAVECRHHLRRAGLKPGDVFLDQANGSEQLIHVLACLLGQFVYCPKQAPHPTEDKISLTCARSDDQGQLVLDTLSWPRLLSPEKRFALILHTSGTTRGIPRSVKLTAEQIRHQIQSHAAIMPLTFDSNRLIVLPGFHSFGLILDRLLGLATGQNLFCFSDGPFHPRRLLDWIKEFDIEWLALVPRTLQLLGQYLDRDPSQSDLTRLHIHSGGAYLHPAERQAWSQRLASFWWGYGLTECGPGVLLNGRPVGCEVRLEPNLDTGLDELWVRSPSNGDWLFREARDGFIATGDIARVACDGSFDVIGRLGDRFKNLNGEWMHLREIEQRVLEEERMSSAHLRLMPEGTHFELRLMMAPEPRAETPRELRLRLQRKLRSTLPLPCMIRMCPYSKDLLDHLANTPKKSLGEALGMLPTQHFALGDD